MRSYPVDKSEKKILFLGAGAIGASVAAWIAPHYNEIYIIDQGEVQKKLKTEGITVYQTGQPEKTRKTVHIKTINKLTDLPDVDIVVLAVKNYSLKKIAEKVKAAYGNKPVIVSMANGMENQSILPDYFSKVIYCVVSYNARRDKPVVVGYQKKGPLLIGTPDGYRRAGLEEVKDIFNLGCETIIMDRFYDAVHTKIVMNLTNALDTLVGQGYRPVSDFGIYQKLLGNTLKEGINIIKAAGYRECKMGGMPSFLLINLNTILPAFITRPIFKHKLKSMVMSSMTQDILLRDSGDSEIESLTGYIVSLADRFDVKAPYNKTIYRLASEKFKKGFTPMSCEDVLAEVKKTELSMD